MTTRSNDLSHKLAEIRTLGNRLNRYGSRLLKEGLKEVTSGRIHQILPSREGDFVDITALVRLGEMNFPGLYRKYTSGLEKLYRLVETI